MRGVVGGGKKEMGSEVKAAGGIKSESALQQPATTRCGKAKALSLR